MGSVADDNVFFLFLQKQKLAQQVAYIRTQTMRILLLRGIAGINERTSGLTHHWFDMVDWRSANRRQRPAGIQPKHRRPHGKAEK
jgi:hypothetical protein